MDRGRAHTGGWKRERNRRRFMDLCWANLRPGNPEHWAMILIHTRIGGVVGRAFWRTCADFRIRHHCTAGRVFEHASTRHPLYSCTGGAGHPYTRGLLASVPKLRLARRRDWRPIRRPEDQPHGD